MNRLRVMVSWDTLILWSSGYRVLQPSGYLLGDQSSISLLATMSRTLRFTARRHLFGRMAETQLGDLHHGHGRQDRPPWRATSRPTVETARSRRPAMSRVDKPEAIPREMSSRSASVSASHERRRAAGAMPPRGNKTHRMEGWGLP